MPRTTDHIRVTHAGSLPRTPELIAANEAKETDGITPEFLDLLETSVVDVVQRQKELGIDIPNDGEYGHTMSSSVDYGAWWNYSFSRLGGLEPTDVDRWADATVHRSSPGHIVLTSFPDRRDREKFDDAYNDPSSGILAHRRAVTQPKIAGPLTYTGQELVASDVANLKTGLAAAGLAEGFIASLSPGSCARVANEYYGSDEELLYACADAMREEYKAIIDAGLTVQLDDPSLAESWDQINPEPSLADYLKFIQLRVEATNWALRGLPRSRSGCMSVGVPGTARTPRTSPSRTSSTQSCRSMPAATPSRRPTSGTSTNGASGRMRSSPRGRSSSPASSRTPPTSWSIRTSWPTGSCASPSSWDGKT